MQKNIGLTMIELMVTISIFAILAAIAAPSFSNFLNNNKLTSKTNELFSAIVTARSEAIKGRTNITLSRKGSSWADGWEVSSGTGDDKVIISQSGAIPSGLSIASSSSSDSVVFNSVGYSKSNHWGDSGIIFCSQQKKGRKVDLSPSGSVQVTEVSCS